MIYAQKSAPCRAGTHWSTPPVFLLAGLAGGALLAAKLTVALWLMLALSIAMVAHWVAGDRPLCVLGQRCGHGDRLGQTGQGAPAGAPPFRPQLPAARNGAYRGAANTRTMLRLIALGLGALAPALLLMLPASYAAAFAALGLHIAGMLSQRWLFFAEAEHVGGPVLRAVTARKGRVNLVQGISAQGVMRYEPFEIPYRHGFERGGGQKAGLLDSVMQNPKLMEGVMGLLSKDSPVWRRAGPAGAIPECGLWANAVQSWPGAKARTSPWRARILKRHLAAMCCDSLPRRPTWPRQKRRTCCHRRCPP